MDAIEKKNVVKRLIVELPSTWHDDIRNMAASRNITIRKWIMQAILIKFAEERQFKEKE